MKYYAVIFFKTGDKVYRNFSKTNEKIQTIFVRTHAHTDTDTHTCKCTQRRVKDVHSTVDRV